MPGTLFVVATPIGNLEDLTFRALRVLQDVDLIAAEDTRRTAKLLAHYRIQKPMVSLREHNERRETPRLVGRLKEGTSIALVSDAGTPGIADPGAGLVNGAREAGVEVVPVPGASALTAALSASGFPLSSFLFLGFAPSSRAKRREWFSQMAEEARPIVFFEAPHRSADMIGHLIELKPARQVAVFRELTKHYEETVVASTSELAQTKLLPQGEFVVVLGPTPVSSEITDQKMQIIDMFGHLTSGTAMSEETARRVTAFLLGLRESLVSNVIRRQRILAKRQSRSSS